MTNSSSSSSTQSQISKLLKSASFLSGQSDSILNFKRTPSFPSSKKGKEKDDSHSNLISDPKSPIEALKNKLNVRLLAFESSIHSEFPSGSINPQHQARTPDEERGKGKEKETRGEEVFNALDLLSRSLGLDEDQLTEGIKSEKQQPFSETGFEALKLLIRLNELITSLQDSLSQPKNFSLGSKDLKAVSTLTTLVLQFLVKPCLKDYDASLDLNVERILNGNEQDQADGTTDEDRIREERSRNQTFQGSRIQEIQEDEELEIERSNQQCGKREMSSSSFLEAVKSTVRSKNSTFKTSFTSLSHLYFLFNELLPTEVLKKGKEQVDSSNQLSVQWSTFSRSLLSSNLTEILGIGLRISFGPIRYPTPSIEAISSIVKQLDSENDKSSSLDLPNWLAETSQVVTSDKAIYQEREVQRGKAGEILKDLMNK